MSKQTDGELVITYGVAAAFSADEDGTVHLPFDVQYGTARATTSGRAGWPGIPCAWCPHTRMPCAVCCAIYLDGGTRDEWYLELGALRLPRRAR